MSRLSKCVAALLFSTTVLFAQDASSDAAVLRSTNRDLAVAFARQYVDLTVPSADQPDQVAAACLTAVDSLRSTAYASYLVSVLQGERYQLQRPAELLPLVESLLAKDDLHGVLRSQLRWYYHRLLRAVGRFEDAAKADPVIGRPREFLCVGPFGGGEDDFANVPFAPELLPWPADSQFSGTSKKPRAIRLPIANGRVEPVDPRDGETGCFYVLNRVVAAQELHAYVTLWVRGTAEVFVNGELVGRVDELLGDGRANHELPVAFAKGLNHIVVKTCSRDSSPFEIEYVDARWRPIVGLREVAASDPVQPAAAPVAAALPPFVDGMVQLQAALASVAGEEQQALRIALGFVANDAGLREVPLEAVEGLEPADAVLQLATARLWRRQSLVPEDRRNASARKLEEAAARTLTDEHFAMLQAAVGLLEEQDRREEALNRLWRSVEAGRAGPQTFRLLLGVAARAKFRSERARILAAWQRALPDDAMVHHELAEDCRRGGAVRRATEYGERAIRLRPDNQDYLSSVYWPLIACGDFGKAQELCDLVMPPVLEDANDRTSRLLWVMGIAGAEPDPARWLRLTDELLAEPRVSVSRLSSMAGDLLRRGHLQRAQIAYQAVLERDPDNLVVQRLLQRSMGAPEPGAVFEQFRHDGDAALVAFRKTASGVDNAAVTAPATTLIEQRIVEVFADGSRYEESHELRRLNDPDGIQYYGNAEAPAAADEVLLLRTIDSKGAEFVPVRMREGYSMPRLEPGVFVEWRYRDFVQAPADGILAVDMFLFGSFADDTLLSELVIIRPKGAEMELRTRGFDKPSEVIDLGDGREALRYTVTNATRLVPDTAMPAMPELVPVVAAGHDHGIGSRLRSGARGLAGLAMPSPPIRRQVEALLAGISAPQAQLQALHDFCHEQIADADSSSATETLLKRQGDRQYLLFAMLKTAGFELQSGVWAAPEELVEDDGALFEDARDYFSGWCVRVQKAGLSPIWMFYDAPRYSPPGWISPTRAGGLVLMHSEQGTELTRLPTVHEHVQHMRIVAVGELSAEGLEVEATLEVRGESSYRAAEHFLQQPAAQQRQFARQFAQSMFRGWQVRGAELLPLEPGSVVQVKATLRRRGLQDDGDRSLLAMPLPESRFLAAFGPRPERTMPMRLNSDVHFSWDLRLRLNGVQLAALPESLTVEHGPLVYLQEARHDGDALVIKRRATMGAGRIPVTGLPAWSRALERLERIENQSLEFVLR
jgi:tetratricopeptide (TPR) repeat protein